jgi:hypothetical protein
MNFRCPHCKSPRRAEDPCAAHLRMVATRCPCCGNSIDMGSLPSSPKVCEPAAAFTRCAILSAKKRLRLFDVARRPQPEPEPIS